MIVRTLLNTLYVTTPHAYLHLDNGTVRIEVERETKLRVPLHHLGGIVVFGNVLVSPALMHRLADQGQSLVLLDGNGRFKARMEGPVSGNILLRRALTRRGRSCGRLARAADCRRLGHGSRHRGRGGPAVFRLPQLPCSC